MKNMKKNTYLLSVFIFTLVFSLPNFVVHASELLSPFTQLNEFTSQPITQVLSVRPSINADSVLAYTNVERYKEGLSLLSSNTLLGEVARKKMLDLFARQYFAHESPTGESVSDLANGVGYRFIVVGENLALGDFGSSQGVVEAWMNSEGHRKNILSKAYSEIGIAAGRSDYKGRTTWIIVQSFGFPRSSCPVIDEELAKKLDTIQQKLDIYSSIAESRKEQIEITTGTLEQRKARVDSYNVVARLYNDTVDEYKKLANEYNDEVGEYNSCLKVAVGRLD